MKIFVLSKDTLLIYGLVILVLVGMFAVGTMSETVITNATVPKDLPIYRVKTDEKKVALTFDAAWGDEDTDKIISVLKQNDAKATFFVVGGFVERCEKSVKKLYDAGHEIANHSDTHLHLSGLNEQEIIKELAGCDEKIQKAAGSSVKLFRAPYGDYDENLVKQAKAQGYEVIQWDVDSLDWKDLSVEEIVSRVEKNIKEGSIVLFHNGAKNTPQALEILLPKLKAQGYEFVKVSELIYKEKFSITAEGEQIKY